MTVAGLLLAAGAGKRFGAPKALARLGGQTLTARACQALSAGGCAPVAVVLGARSAEVRPSLPDGVQAVYAADWESGMGASLRAGLQGLASIDGPDAALIHLVDLPWIGADVIARLASGAGGDTVRRASYEGAPGHPVVLGRSWWAEVAGSMRGDKGARDWLAARDDLELIECADLADGSDADTPQDLNR